MLLVKEFNFREIAGTYFHFFIDFAFFKKPLF